MKELHNVLAERCSDALDTEQYQFVLECQACFHIRNANLHDDGSRGDIKITPYEFLDILAYAYMNGVNYAQNNHE